MLRLPLGFFRILKEILRHLLRRPVVGINIFATTSDGRVLLIRRGDTGDWALPGGTVEWGENLRDTAVRELLEEAGVTKVTLGNLVGVFSDPQRDPRFHAVTIVCSAEIEEPSQAPYNPAEILEAKLFERSGLPTTLSHGNIDMLNAALSGQSTWE